MRISKRVQADATFLLAIFCGGMVLRWFLYPPADYSAYDELGYTWIASNLIKSGFIPLPTSSFVILSNGGYFFAFKPPLLVYLLAVAYSVGGVSLTVGRILVSAIGLLAVVPLFFLARRLFNTQVAVISVIIFALLPVNDVIGSLITPTAIAGTFTTAAVYMLYRESEAKKPLVLTSFFLFLSLLSEVWGLLIVGLIILLLIQSKGKVPSLSVRNLVMIVLAMIPFFVVVILPITVANSTPLVSHDVSGQNFASSLLYDASVVSYQLITPEIVPSVVTLLSIIGLFYIITRRSHGDKFMLLVVFASLVTLIVGATFSGGIATTGRYFIPFTPYIAITSAVGICYLSNFILRIANHFGLNLNRS